MQVCVASQKYDPLKKSKYATRFKIKISEILKTEEMLQFSKFGYIFQAKDDIKGARVQQKSKPVMSKP